MDRPTLRQLEAFDAVARLGGFRAAAREMGISQVAISDHIRQLEAKLGVALFERSRGAKTELSPIGIGALARARLILVDCDALIAAVRTASRPLGVVQSAHPPARPSTKASPPPPQPFEDAEPEDESWPGEGEDDGADAWDEEDVSSEEDWDQPPLSPASSTKAPRAGTPPSNALSGDEDEEPPYIRPPAGSPASGKSRQGATPGSAEPRAESAIRAVTRPPAPREDRAIGIAEGEPQRPITPSSSPETPARQSAAPARTAAPHRFRAWPASSELDDPWEEATPATRAAPPRRAQPLPPEEPASLDAPSPITIGAHSAIFARFQEQLAAFEDAFPERPLSIDFSIYMADRAALALSEGAIDMAYFYALGETRVFPSDYLWSERWSLYVGTRHRLAQSGMVRREDLAREPLLGLAANNRLRPVIDACLAEGKLDTLPMALETDDFALLTELTQDGAGILPLFGALAAQIGAAPGIKRIAYVDPIPAVEVRRVLHPRVAEDAVVQALAATLS